MTTRKPSWQLVSRQPCRWPARCPDCAQQIPAGEHAAFWTNDPSGRGPGLIITCALCHPAGADSVELEEPRQPGAPPPCPACGTTALIVPTAPRYRGQPAQQHRRKPPWCPQCKYVHTVAQAGR